MVKRFNGKTAVNARIKIDYSKDKPSVKFSYPDKKSQFKGSMGTYVFFGWFLLVGVISLFISAGLSITAKPAIEDNPICYDNVEKILEEKKDIIINKVCDSLNDSLVVSVFNDALDVTELKDFGWKKPTFLLLILFGVPSLIYYPKKKWWDSFYPKFQAWKARKKVAILKPEDVKKENGKYYCEIPVFENIVLNYKADKDFSKYLDLFEITEHKFKYYKAKAYKKNKLKPKARKRANLKRRKETINEWLWYARFYFTQKPKTGMLEVLFK